jgi:hypothetical protein
MDVISIGLLIAAAASFGFGIVELGQRRDLHALYWLIVGALVLRAATELLRPRGAR